MIGFYQSNSIIKKKKNWQGIIHNGQLHAHDSKKKMETEKK